VKRAEIIREKGTNRSAFFRGEIDKYGWVDIGSSFLPSEIISAFLFAQIEHLDDIQEKRKAIWSRYYENLKPLAESGYFSLPFIPDYATNNAHMFYVVCNNLTDRSGLIEYLKQSGINAVFHYLSLHKSEFYASKHEGGDMKNADHYSECLVRLPMYAELLPEQVDFICGKITNYFLEKKENQPGTAL
jgi:dTDP-4-amino-4,6-dideoxygalactose transaminase